MQRRISIAIRRGNGGYDGVEQRLHVRTERIGRKPGIAVARGGIHHGKIKLLRRGAELDEKLQRFIHHFKRPCAGPVHLVDHHNRRLVQRKRLAQHKARLRHAALKRIHKQEHAVHHLQDALHLAAEVRVTRCVHNVDTAALIVDGRVLGKDGDAALAFQIARIHHALLHLLVRAEHAALAEQAIHKRGLAVVNVRDDRNVANVFVCHTQVLHIVK